MHYTLILRAVSLLQVIKKRFFFFVILCSFEDMCGINAKLTDSEFAAFCS